MEVEGVQVVDRNFFFRVDIESMSIHKCYLCLWFDVLFVLVLLNYLINISFVKTLMTDVLLRLVTTGRDSRSTRDWVVVGR